MNPLIDFDFINQLNSLVKGDPLQKSVAINFLD